MVEDFPSDFAKINPHYLYFKMLVDVPVHITQYPFILCHSPGAAETIVASSYYSFTLVYALVSASGAVGNKVLHSLSICAYYRSTKFVSIESYSRTKREEVDARRR